MVVSMSGAGKTEHIPLQVSSKITGGEVRGHGEAWTWTTHPDFKSTKEQSPVTRVPLSTCFFELQIHTKGEPAKSWGQESTQGHSANWGQSSSEKAPLSLALVV